MWCQLERKVPLLLGDCSQARAGFWPPTCPLGQGLCEQTAQVVFGDPDHGTRQQGLGALTRIPLHTSRMTTISALADLKRSGWSSGSPEGLGSGRTLGSYRYGELERELWFEMLPYLGETGEFRPTALRWKVPEGGHLALQALGKAERETDLCLLVQTGSHCSTFDNTELFFSFWRGSAVSEELEEGILRRAN